MPYLLDADVFIRAKRDHYRHSVCPGFWDWLAQASAAGTVYSIDKVKDELLNGSAPFMAWLAARPAGFFLTADAGVLVRMPAVSAWVNGRGCTPAATSVFFGNADFLLVAHALARGFVLVTHELPAPLSKRSVKIPDVCNGLGVTWTNPYQMLEDEGVRLVLP